MLSAHVFIPRFGQAILANYTLIIMMIMGDYQKERRIAWPGCHRVFCCASSWCLNLGTNSYDYIYIYIYIRTALWPDAAIRHYIQWLELMPLQVHKQIRPVLYRFVNHSSTFILAKQKEHCLCWSSVLKPQTCIPPNCSNDVCWQAHTGRGSGSSCTDTAENVPSLLQ